MNIWALSASDLLVWGIVLHLIADWPFQNNWMANNKMKRRERKGWRRNDHGGRPIQNLSRWWDRHPAAYVHAGIHGIFLSLIFGWVAIPLAVIHLLIDTRVPLVWWGTKVIKQSQPKNNRVAASSDAFSFIEEVPLYDMGAEVRIWTDQVFHIACIAVTALLIA